MAAEDGKGPGEVKVNHGGVKGAAPSSSPSGDGIRSLQTSNVFRTLNFELYARPNKYMMVFGAVTFTSCVAYMMYLKHQWKDAKVCTVIDERDELVLRRKRSGWD